MAHRLVSLAFVSLLLVAPATVIAQSELADPTRPPTELLADEAAPGDGAGPVLQSVLILKKGRAVAVIGGEQVRLGEMYGDSRLIKLTEREAVLEGPSGVERLMLTPGIEKTNIVMRKAKKSSAPRRAQSEGRP